MSTSGPGQPQGSDLIRRVGMQWTPADSENLAQIPWGVLRERLISRSLYWNDEGIIHRDESIRVEEFIQMLRGNLPSWTRDTKQNDFTERSSLRELSMTEWVGVTMESLICDRNRFFQEISTAAKRSLIKRITLMQAEPLMAQDSLTGIANRVATQIHLESLIRMGSPFTLISLDLSKFKSINDSYGHAAGDHVLRTVAERWHTLMRASDWLGRWGGDEFIVAIPARLSTEARHGFIQRIDEASQKPITLTSLSVVSVATSAGYADFPDDAGELEELMAVADRRLYSVKYEENKKSIVSSNTTAQRKWQTRIDKAIQTGQIEVYYQPIITQRGMRATHWEAFVRFRDKRGKLYGPPRFFNFLTADTISDLDRAVTQIVFQSLTLWHREELNYKISINLNPDALLTKGWFDYLECLHQKYSTVRSTDIIFEIRESLMTSSAFRILEALMILKRRGYQIALDNFGTGNSTLHRLQQLPISFVKLDSVLTREWQSSIGEVIIKAVVSLSKPMGFAVIAAGIETEAQNHAMQSWGCAGIQGWYYSRDMSVREVLRWRFPGTIS